MNNFTLNTPEEISLQLAQRMKQMRLNLSWKQQTLAERSGVSLASLRRFENKGLISLQSLLNLAMALDCLDDFEMLFTIPAARSIKELEENEPKAQRGRL